MESEILKEMSINAIGQASNWAGQLEWPQIAKPSHCAWQGNGRCMVLADGRISLCCTDGLGVEIIGHIDKLEDCLIGPGNLCKSCHLYPPTEYDEIQPMGDMR